MPSSGCRERTMDPRRVLQRDSVKSVTLTDCEGLSPAGSIFFISGLFSFTKPKCNNLHFTITCFVRLFLFCFTTRCSFCYQWTMWSQWVRRQIVNLVWFWVLKPLSPHFLWRNQDHAAVFIPHSAFVTSLSEQKCVIFISTVTNFFFIFTVPCVCEQCLTLSKTNYNHSACKDFVTFVYLTLCLQIILIIKIYHHICRCLCVFFMLTHQKMIRKVIFSDIFMTSVLCLL